MFVHTLATTRAVSFADVLMSTSYGLELTQATEKRATLVHVLKTIQEERVAHEERGAAPAAAAASHQVPALLTRKDWLKAVQCIDDYLPWVRSLDTCLKTDDVIARAELAFSWKDTLAAAPVKATLPGIQFELLSVLIVSGKAASNLAASLVASVGDYEHTEAATLNTDQRKQREDKLKFAADLYCRAAGSFDYAGNVVVPQWETEVGSTQLGQQGRSLESTREMCMALSRLAQAEAESVALRKLLSPTTCYQTASGTSAPPLPSDHPSPSLLAKLYLNCAAHFESALSLSTTAGNAAGIRAETPGSSANALQQGKQRTSLASPGSLSSRVASKFNGNKLNRASEEATRNGKIAPGFVKYLRKSASVSRARAYLWLGVDKGECGEYGEAIAFLQLASEQVADISSSTGAANKLHIGKASTLEHKREQKRHFVMERDAVADAIQQWSKAYKQLNDTIGFKPVPLASSVTSQIPAGRAATAVKALRLPTPAFGPGSVDYTAKNLSGLHSLGGRGERDGNGDLTPLTIADQTSSPRESQAESYAGQGAYY